MNMKELEKAITEGNKKLETQKTKYKDFLENYTQEKGDHLVYLYLNCNDLKNFDMDYNTELNEFVYDILIKEKKLSEKEVMDFTDKICEELHYSKIKSVDELKDENIRKFVLDKLASAKNN